MKKTKDNYDLSSPSGRIKYIREVKLKLTQEEFGALCGGKTKGAVSQWESGTNEMGGPAIVGLWKTSSVNPEWLIYGGGPEMLPLTSVASREDEVRSAATRALLEEMGYNVDRLLELEKKVTLELGENVDKKLLTDIIKQLYKLEKEKVTPEIIRAFYMVALP